MKAIVRLTFINHSRIRRMKAHEIVIASGFVANYISFENNEWLNDRTTEQGPMETLIRLKIAGFFSLHRSICIPHIHIILMFSHQMIMTPIWVHVQFSSHGLCQTLLPSSCSLAVFPMNQPCNNDDVDDEQLSAKDLVNMKMIQFHFVPCGNTSFTKCMDRLKLYSLSISLSLNFKTTITLWLNFQFKSFTSFTAY